MTAVCNDVGSLVDAATGTPASRDALLRLLREQAPIYSGRSTRETIRMRGYILAAFERVGLPESALPYVLEELQIGRDAYLVAAAAKALRGGERSRLPNVLPLLQRAGEMIAANDVPVSFDSYDPPWPYPRGTTAASEIAATVEWLGTRPKLSDLPGCCEMAATPARPLRNVTLQDQNGDHVDFDEYFQGKPSVVVFFYTRCDNPAKCSLTVSTFARLQNDLELRGLAGEVRLAGLTYDPRYDLPHRLKTFGEFRGVRFHDDVRFFRPVQHADELRSWFDLGVNYAGAIVNRHRVEVYILDRRGQIAGSFTRLQWTAEAVLGVIEPMIRRPRVAVAKLFLQTAPPLLLAALPKCPLCLAAYATAIGAGAVQILKYRPVMLLAMVAFLIVHFTMLLRRSRRTGTLASLLPSVAGAALLAGSFLWNVRAAGMIGALLLAAGAVIGSVRSETAA